MQVSVLVQESSAGNFINQSESGLIVSLRAAHDPAKADKALVCVLAKHFKVPKSAVTVENGETSAVQIVQITKHPA